MARILASLIVNRQNIKTILKIELFHDLFVDNHGGQIYHKIKSKKPGRIIGLICQIKAKRESADFYGFKKIMNEKSV